MRKKEKICRFGVKDDHGNFSSIWRAWVNKNDAFLTIGYLANQYKASFHESGECHVGLTQEVRKSLSDLTWKGESRHFYKWRREKNIRKNQLIHLLDLWFPTSHLDLPIEMESLSKKEILWINNPAGERMVSVGVFLANIEEPFGIRLNSPNSGLLCSLSLLNGYKFVLLWRYIDEPSNLIDFFPNYIHCALHPNENEKTFGKIDHTDIVSPGKRLLIWKIVDGLLLCIEISPRKVFDKPHTFENAFAT
ncbi:MAG: hypothetical protein JRI59_09460 [Deltaproteobacteria bacterium]|nr:hypothetical protein [Deltaproteobacteria bacterium]